MDSFLCNVVTRFEFQCQKLLGVVFGVEAPSGVASITETTHSAVTSGVEAYLRRWMKISMPTVGVVERLAGRGRRPQPQQQTDMDYVADYGLRRIAWIIRITGLRIIVGPVRICNCPVF